MPGPRTGARWIQPDVIVSTETFDPRELRLRALVPLQPLQPLQLLPGRTCRPLGRRPQDLEAFVGFTLQGARPGERVAVRRLGELPGFRGLVPGREHWLCGPHRPSPYDEIRPPAWVRSVGLALDEGTLLLTSGPVFRKALTMAPYTLNGNGHFVPDSPPTGTPVLTHEMHGNVMAFRAAASRDADDKATVLDGTETLASAFIGITDGPYLAGATATIYPPGTQLTTTGLSLVAGEVYADLDGSLKTWAGVFSGTYTLCVGISDGDNHLIVTKGEVKLKP